jgi:MFS family permease
MGLLQSIFRPTQAALLPLLARTPRELTAANLVLTTIESVGLFVGPAFGGLLLAVTGTDTVFAVTGVVFLLAALLLVRVSVRRTPQASAPRRSFVRDAFAGFGTVAHDAKLRLLIGLYGTQTLVAGAMNVLIVVMALETLDLGNAGIGFLNSAWGVGGLLGGARLSVRDWHSQDCRCWGLLWSRAPRRRSSSLHWRGWGRRSSTSRV